MKHKQHKNIPIAQLQSIENIGYCGDCGARSSFMFNTPNGVERMDISLLLSTLWSVQDDPEFITLPTDWWNKTRCAFALDNGKMVK